MRRAVAYPHTHHSASAKASRSWYLPTAIKMHQKKCIAVLLRSAASVVWSMQFACNTLLKKFDYRNRVWYIFGGALFPTQTQDLTFDIHNNAIFLTRLPASGKLRSSSSKSKTKIPRTSSSEDGTDGMPAKEVRRGGQTSEKGCLTLRMNH